MSYLCPTKPGLRNKRSLRARPVRWEFEELKAWGGFRSKICWCGVTFRWELIYVGVGYRTHSTDDKNGPVINTFSIHFGFGESRCVLLSSSASVEMAGSATHRFLSVTIWAKSWRRRWSFRNNLVDLQIEHQWRTRTGAIPCATADKSSTASQVRGLSPLAAPI